MPGSPEDKTTVIRAFSPGGTPPDIPDHQLIRCIGSGGYGEVWLAKNVLGAYRAIKIVYRKSFDNDRPYEREFSGIKKFEPVSRSHDSQVDILHVGRNDKAGYFFYIMELADPQRNGQQLDPETYTPKTLRSEIQQRGRLPAKECRELATALTGALSHLHKSGLIHRDIKPANIIFVNGRPKLADIGLVTGIADTKSFVGTEGYFPPEGPGTPKADIYSLGKVLYEIATGRDRIDFPELPTSLRDFPDREELLALNQVILKACDDNPRRRYGSAQRMNTDVMKLANCRKVKCRLIISGAVLLALSAFAFLTIRWFRQSTLEINSNLPGATVTLRGTASPLKTFTVQSAPLFTRLRKGTYALEAQCRDFKVSTNVVVNARKQRVPVHFEYGILSIEAFDFEAQEHILSTNLIVTPGAKLKEPLVIDGYQAMTIEETARAGETKRLPKLLIPPLTEIEARPVTALVEVRNSTGKMLGNPETQFVAKKLSPGNYSVVLRYKSIALTNNIVVNGSTPRKLRFDIPVGKLRLVADDGWTEVPAQIWHGTNSIGITTDPFPNYWPAGTWTFRLEAMGYEATNVVVTLQPDVPATIRQALLPVVGPRFHPLASNSASLGMVLVWVQSVGICVGKHEVTQFEYQTVIRTNNHPLRGDPRLPITSITWGEAKDFCQKLTALEKKAGTLLPGFVYDLPTQKEWDAFLADATFEHAVTSQNGQRSSPDIVGSLPANKYGLHDVLGNVWEWCADGPNDLEKVVRGAAFNTQSTFLTAATAHNLAPDQKSNDVGFRCVLVRR